LIEKYQVTLWDSVPTSVALVVEQLDFAKRQSTAPIRNILMSGDWIDPALPKRIWESFTNTNAISMGGATEGSIWSIYYRITQDSTGWKSVPYGKPLANQSFYVLNDHLRQVPPGVVGELFIGGIGVAREYYAAPELSNSRFIYHQGLKTRLYRTGDMGKYLEDGNIQFMGRVDDQVKINGFRIETGEIEQQLNLLPDVFSSLVTVHKLESGVVALVAYVQLEKNNGLSESSATAMFRSTLSDILPYYMVPKFFVLIDKWPLTANGKVDKKSLPVPSSSVWLSNYETPSTKIEILLSELWAQLLNIDKDIIGIHHNFMDVGGNSLLVIRMIAQLESSLAIKLDLKTVYSNLTINSLGELISNSQAVNDLVQEYHQMSEDQVEEISL
jgi:acyl-coenzyme A synthetase/AMP-(fatty) acid ligase/acyl carrier protein